MLKEALQFQHELGKAACCAKLLDLPDSKVLLVKPGGDTQILDRDRPLRKDSVATLGSLIDWLDEVGAGRNVDVWVSDSSAMAVADFEVPTTSDSVTLPFKHSRAWLALADWNGKGIRQKEAVRILRGPLFDTFDGNHLRVFKSLDFNRKNDGSRTVSHKGESMGKSVEAAAQSKDGDIPEVIAFTVPCYDFEESPKVIVKMAVEVDPEAETISLFVMGDSFIQGVRASLAEIKERIEGAASANVYLS